MVFGFVNLLTNEGGVLGMRFTQLSRLVRESEGRLC
ncbi:hypothetical protein FIU82_03820 [Pseudoalteromonas sp. THAF3]|nr:hypothetical protein FIU82_03820 [Pseudoalteromonas sp. THAF3]